MVVNEAIGTVFQINQQESGPGSGLGSLFGGRNLRPPNHKILKCILLYRSSRSQIGSGSSELTR